MVLSCVGQGGMGVRVQPHPLHSLYSRDLSGEWLWALLLLLGALMLCTMVPHLQHVCSAIGFP